jgi:hypothetical protein
METHKKGSNTEGVLEPFVLSPQRYAKSLNSTFLIFNSTI